jgi:hypothetical protein
MKRLRFLATAIVAASLVFHPYLAHAAETVTASVLPGVTVTGTTSVTGGVVTSASIKLPSGYAPISFASGTSAGQVSVKWSNTLTLAAAPTSLDLTNLSGGTGAATFTKVKLLAIYSTDAANSGNDVTVGNSGADDWTGPLSDATCTYTIKAGGSWVVYDLSTTAMTVDGTHKILQLDPGAQTCHCVVVVAGN